MELLFVTVIGLGLGLLVRYLLPGRDSHGILLLPAIGGAVTSAVWVALVWLGWTFDGTWIWVVSLVAGVLAAGITGLVLPRRRATEDAEMLARLGAVPA